MKKLLLLCLVLVSFSFKANSQIVFSENWDGIGPGISAWSVYNQDGLTPASGVSTITDAWVSRTEEFDNHVVTSTSWYTPAGTSDDWLVSPSITIPSTGSTILYWDARAYDSTYKDSYNVFVSASGNTPSDFTNPAEFTQGDGTTGSSGENVTWTRRSVDLSAYAGQTIYLGFQNFSTDMFLLSLDNIMVVNNNTCLAPNRTMTSSQTTNSATISWTAVAGATSYDVAFDVPGFTPSTPTATVSTATYTASGLTPNTEYEYYVRNSCGSEWIGPFAVVTFKLETPYAYGFETPLGANGWSTLASTTAGGGSWGQYTGATLAQEGSSFGACLGTTVATNSWLFSNGISLTSGEVLTINYYYRKYNGAGTTSVNKLKSSIGTAKTAAAMTTTIFDHGTVTPLTYTLKTSNYTVPSSGVYYLGFNCYTGVQTATNYGGVFVDNITITSNLSNNQFDLASGMFLIMPNPVQNTFELKLSEKFDTNNAAITILDLDGKVVKEFKYSNSYDVSTLSKGVYFVSITDGTLKEVKKLIKE